MHSGDAEPSRKGDCMLFFYSYIKKSVTVFIYKIIKSGADAHRRGNRAQLFISFGTVTHNVTENRGKRLILLCYNTDSRIKRRN